ncbi:MAG: DinB family protein [Anaerolinea sp.]|nr:DinB family protein [Anaerolinea sp.]MCC6973971.1 DinB family protein [Anaerolineae bacterium]CAG0999239.1 hypothetical protein ANRL4_03002 [Anaerolineae bacterium]
MENVLEVVQQVLRTTPVRWLGLTQSLSPDVLKHSPASGEWSAHECLQHLVDTERSVFPVRIRAFLAGQDFPAFDPDSQGTKPEASLAPVELAAEFARLREQSLELLQTLNETDLPRQARHSELGLVSLSEMIHEWAGHDLMHTVQGEQALMQPFIEGCGAWQKYFSKHIVDTK